MFRAHCLWLYAFWAEEKASVTKAGTEKGDNLVETICLFSQKDVNSFYIAPPLSSLNQQFIYSSLKNECTVGGSV